MGFVNFYYFQAWSRNQAMEKEREKEEAERAKQDKEKNSNNKLRTHPAQGRGFSIPPNMLEDLQDELE